MRQRVARKGIDSRATAGVDWASTHDTPLEVPMADANIYRHAACRDVDPETFFPVGDKEEGPEVELAREICQRCRISEICLQDHIGMPYGVFAGTTPGQRRAILRRHPELARR